MVSNMSAWGEPLGTPAKGDKWDIVLGNLWAWDQFGRQGGGVKLHILLIKKRKQWVTEIYRCLGLWKREGRRLIFWNGTCEVALGRTSLLCVPYVLLVTHRFSLYSFHHLKQISGSLWDSVPWLLNSHLSYFPSHLIPLYLPDSTL